MRREISGDGRMAPLDRVRWLASNACRNIAGAFAAVPLERGQPDAAAKAQAQGWRGSPSRLVSDAVLRRELSGLFAGRPIAILDIGCGSGGARRHFVDAGLHGSYLGIDIEDRFDRKAGFAGIESRFEEGDAHAVALPPADLVFSFSALEHIPRDIGLIARLRGVLRPGGAQVHVVPGGWAILPYLWHGWRHYPRRALAERFDLDRCRVIAIGGPAALLLHTTMIAVPEILLRFSLRDRVPGLYGRLVAASLKIDAVLPGMATNYVVIERAPGATP
jgi:SAM-dependent methyltransferase